MARTRTLRINFAGNEHIDVTLPRAKNDDDLLSWALSRMNSGAPEIVSDASGRRVVIAWSTVTSAYLVP